MMIQERCVTRERRSPAGRTLRVVLAVLATVAVSPLSGCSTSEPPPATSVAPSGTALKGAGSTFASVLFDRWFSVYHERHPEITVSYDAVGSGEGVRRFIGRNLNHNETVDFGASDSAMSDTELGQTEAGAVMLPITGGCVVLAYHLPSLRGDLKLTRSAYVGIFRGEVNKWNDARIARSNPGVALPDSTIGRIVRQDRSGTTFALAAHLAAIDEQWRQQFAPATLISWPGDAIRAKGNDGVAGMILNFEGSIGYVGYEFARRLRLPMASLENRQGEFVRPSAESCAEGLATVDLPDNLRAFVVDPPGAASYPIVTFSWALVRKKYENGQTATAVRELFRWCLGEGQGYAADLGYVPLPAEVARRAVTALDAAGAGG